MEGQAASSTCRNYELDDLLEIWDDRQIDARRRLACEHRSDVLRRTRCRGLPDLAAVSSAPRFMPVRGESPTCSSSGAREAWRSCRCSCGHCRLAGATLAEAPPDAAAGRQEHRLATTRKTLIRSSKDVAKKAREAVAAPAYTAVPPAALRGHRPRRSTSARLPETGALLFGRREELKFLDQAWAERNDSTSSCSGPGAASASRPWSAAGSRSWPRTTTAVPSGCSAGPSSARAPAIAKASRAGTSADQFISEALHFFGDRDPRRRPLGLGPQGERLAELVRSQAHAAPAGRHGAAAVHPCSRPARRDHGSRLSPRLSRSWRATTRGLCIVTTRGADQRTWPISGRSAVARDLELDFVNPLAGRALLRERGVRGQGRPSWSRRVEAFGGHALCLAACSASYLRVLRRSADSRCRRHSGGRSSSAGERPAIRAG